MFDYVIVTDSGCDLGAEMVQRFDLKYAPLKLNYPDRTLDIYADERDITIKEFYQSMRDGAVPKTSSTTAESWISCVEPELEAGRDVLMLPFSSGLSATYETAVIAAEQLKGQYPDRKIYALDIGCASLGQGLLTYHACMCREQGMNIEETVAYVEKNKLHLCHWFTVENLVYLRRGGRISAATALAGTVLGIKPVLHVDDEGHLINVSKSRGRKASLVALADKLKETAIEPEKQIIFISHGDCLEDAKLLEQLVRERTAIKECYINEIGPVIGAHSGPGTVALFFYGTKR